MSVSEFQQAISSPALRRVAEHWIAARGSHRMAPWSAINPKAMTAELPILWAYKYDSATDTFTGRLSGQRIVEFFGRNLRGLSMREIYPEKDYDRLFQRSKRLITTPALFRGHGPVFRHVERYGQGERIMMPLADDGETGDGLLGATVYESRQGEPSAGGSETESWFAL